MSKKTRKNPLVGIANYFKEVRSELKKVVWPTLKQIQNNTIIVIFSLIFVGAIIWIFDLGFAATLGKVVETAPAPQTEVQPDENAAPIGDTGTPLPDSDAQQNQTQTPVEQENAQ
ncbi:MAG: preprotein translocase subunit SecE [Clostridiaceae bacterium]|nr:preprotein translocase subunit SecE [Clostridiaceae bacterium]